MMSQETSQTITSKTITSQTTSQTTSQITSQYVDDLIAQRESELQKYMEENQEENSEPKYNMKITKKLNQQDSSLERSLDDPKSFQNFIEQRENDLEESLLKNQKTKLDTYLLFKNHKIPLVLTGVFESLPPIWNMRETSSIFNVDNSIPYDLIFEDGKTIELDNDIQIVFETKDQIYKRSFGNMGYMFIKKNKVDERFEGMGIKLPSNYYIRFPSVSSDSFHKVKFKYNLERKCLEIESVNFRFKQDDLFNLICKYNY